MANVEGAESAQPVATPSHVNNLEMASDDGVVDHVPSDGSGDEEEDDHEHDTAHYKNANGVITISDSDSEDDDPINATWQANNRPWREPNFDHEKRKVWESMYAEIQKEPIHNDWATTEDYQCEKDKEMLRYMNDFPLSEWVIPQEQAREAYKQLEERSRWRGFNIRIYGSRSIPVLQPYQSTGPRTTQMQMGPPPPVSHYRGPGPADPLSRSSLPMQLPSRPMQQGVPGGFTSHSPAGMAPPPSNVLPSQPNAQPLPSHANVVPIYAPAMDPAMAMGMYRVPNVPVQHQSQIYGPHPQQIQSDTPSNRGKAREKRTETPPVEMTAPRAPTPPYETRPKPTERKTINKTGGRNLRRHAGAEIFPWNRELDFKVARANATWDDGIYEQKTLDEMVNARAKNEPLIERIDGEEIERQRQTRFAKKKGTGAETSSDVEKPRRKSKAKSSSTKPKGISANTGDPYHSGDFCFATADDEQRASQLSKSTIDEIMAAHHNGTLSLETCAKIKICWNPGKRGITQDLEQASFTIKDTIVTRQQLDVTPILTRRAAECIVDFCPDLLWREMLLRITSEAGLGNKDVRDRMCHNGNYVDKATITKRIGAALGQKQQQSTAKNRKKPDPSASDPALLKNKGYMKGEDDFYNTNVSDHHEYVAFFGKRTSHRTALKFQTAGNKRKRTVEDDVEASGEEMIADVQGKSSKEDRQAIQSPGILLDSGETTGVEVDSDSSDGSDIGEDNADAVSIQSDTVLDQMDED